MDSLRMILYSFRQFISLGCINFNQLEKLEAARSAYLWLPFLTFPYLSLPILPFPYLSLPFLTYPYLSFPFLTFPVLMSKQQQTIKNERKLRLIGLLSQPKNISYLMKKKVCIMLDYVTTATCVHIHIYSMGLFNRYSCALAVSSFTK